MASPLANAAKLLTNPAMVAAFVRYKTTGTRTLDGDIKIGGFPSFSEFYALPAPEPRELAVVKAAARLGGIAVDAGANVGQYSLAMARAGFERVVGFEPVPSTQRAFRANVALNPKLAPRITLVDAGLSDAEGTVSFDVGDSHAVNHIATNGAASTVTCNVTTLDAYFPTEAIALLKMDVEGSEQAALRGAARMFAEGRVRLVYVEMWDWNPPRPDHSPEGIAAILEAYGFTPMETASFLVGKMKPLSLADARAEAGSNLMVLFARA